MYMLRIKPIILFNRPNEHLCYILDIIMIPFLGIYIQ